MKAKSPRRAGSGKGAITRRRAAARELLAESGHGPVKRISLVHRDGFADVQWLRDLPKGRLLNLEDPELQGSPAAAVGGAS